MPLIAIVCSNGTFAYPCGICRQFISEFMLDGTVIIEDKNAGIREIPVKDLLPEAFTRKDLING